MSSELLNQLKQTKPFASLTEEASVSIALTAAALQDGIERTLKPFGISATQYNVLRILRGAGPAGLCRNEVRDRLITRMPDVTRLLDRMEQAQLVVRERDTEDRRLVSTRLTAAGRKLVDELDEPVTRTHQQLLGHLSVEQLRSLIGLLDEARTASR